jgi:hypothetical protein
LLKNSIQFVKVWHVYVYVSVFLQHLFYIFTDIHYKNNNRITVLRFVRFCCCYVLLYLTFNLQSPQCYGFTGIWCPCWAHIIISVTFRIWNWLSECIQTCWADSSIYHWHNKLQFIPLYLIYMSRVEEILTFSYSVTVKQALF